jgi:hypothetical protein
LYNGVLLEVDADGDIVIPLVVGEVPEAGDTVEDEPIQDAAGNVSVRNVVPTLTSNKRRGLSLNGQC